MHRRDTRFSRRQVLGTGVAWLAALGIHRRGLTADDSPPAPAGAEVRREFIFETAPFAECHASTLVNTHRGLFAAWFGGTREGHPDVGIYLARRTEAGWSAPQRVIDGWSEEEARRYPCWNPVLFLPREGPLLLFYKVGPRPSSWWGMFMASHDHGRTWSVPERLPAGNLGPVRAKPVQLADGTILCGSSVEDAGWLVQMESTRDPSGAWTRTPPLNRGDEWSAIQPTILEHNSREIQILCRSRQGSILESWSLDSGKTWSRLSRTTLPNPNSGIDAVRLRDGRFLLVYNHTQSGRGVLNVALSNDGRKWLAAHVLERGDGEYSYPAAIETDDGRVHISYTWDRRRIRHVELDPARLGAGKPIVDGRWPE